MEVKNETNLKKKNIKKQQMSVVCEWKHINPKARLPAGFGSDLRGLQVAAGAQRADRLLKGGDGCATTAGKRFDFL